MTVMYGVGLHCKRKANDLMFMFCLNGTTYQLAMPCVLVWSCIVYGGWFCLVYWCGHVL